MVLNRVKGKAEMQPANLFFLELLIVLLFFSLSAAIILQVFTAADRKQKLGETTESAIVCAQSVAECYSVTGDIEETVLRVFGTEVTMEDGAVILHLNGDLIPSEDGAIDLVLTQKDTRASEAGVLSYIGIEFTLGEEELFAMECSAYAPDNGGATDE